MKWLILQLLIEIIFFKIKPGLWDVSENFTGYNTDFTQAGWFVRLYFFSLFFFFFLSILASIMVKTMIRERCPASPEAGWRCESEVS